MKGPGEDIIKKLTDASDCAVKYFLDEAFHMTDKHREDLQTAEDLAQIS